MKEKKTVSNRRKFLKGSAAAAATTAISAPFIGNAQAQSTTTWKIQTSWPGGIGLEIFKEWCNSIVEKTGGELGVQAIWSQRCCGRLPII